MNYIEKEKWEYCSICKCKSRAFKKHNINDKYYSQIFITHVLTEHSLSPEEYFCDIVGLERPKCKCGICNKLCSISYRGSWIVWTEYQCGRNEGVKKWSEEAKKTRCGPNNPMFGKPPWNIGLTKDNSASLMTVSKKMSNRIISENTRQKMSKSAKERTFHGHTNCKHSNETKTKLRESTLNMIRNGRYNHIDTKPVKKFQSILDYLRIEYIREKVIGYYSFDFYLCKYDIFIEIDGDYWHSNPKIYPNGPITKTQKINFCRDISKDNFCKKESMKLYRFWESDILNEEESLICKLKELLKLEV